MILRNKFNYYRKWLRYLWCRHRNLSQFKVDTMGKTLVWVECKDCLYAKFYTIVSCNYTTDFSGKG